MKKEELILRAKELAWERYGRCNLAVLAEAINEGLRPGDNIRLAPGQVVKIIDDDVAEMPNGQRVKLSEIPAPALDQLLLLKAVKRAVMAVPGMGV